MMKGVCLAVLLGAACICDLKTYRIPNVLCGLGCLTGCFWNTVLGGINGLGFALAGMLIPPVILFVLYRSGVLGAGDVKLFAAVGSVVGTGILKVIIWSFAAFACWGLVVVCRHILKGKFTLTRSRFSVSVAVGTLAAYLMGRGG